MNSSPTITKIAAALVKAQGEMGNAKKEAVNPFFKKSYADLNSVREATLPVLNANGISVIQPTCVLDGINYVETILLHESGEFISSLTQIITDKPNDAQRHGSGLSYARRYALASITNIGADDDDGNLAVSGAKKSNKPDPIAAAISEMYLSKNIAEVQTNWSRYKQYQTDERFMGAKNEMKNKLADTKTEPA